MAEREPHPSAHTHGDEYEKHLFDRILTELEGIHDVLRRAHKPAEVVQPQPKPAVPVKVAIEEPAPARPRPAVAKPSVKKTTAAKRQPSKES